MNSRPSSSAHRRRAFTLIEAVIASLIVGIALVPAMSMVGVAARDRAIQNDLAAGMTLARNLMSEIVQTRYADPDATEAGEVRATWDDVSDYNGLSQSPPLDRNGLAIPGYTGWTQSVRVTLVSTSDLASASATDKGLKLIIVNVTSPLGRKYTLTALRSSNSTYERTPSASTTYASDVTVTIEPTGGQSLTAGVNLVNQVP